MNWRSDDVFDEGFSGDGGCSGVGVGQICVQPFGYDLQAGVRLLFAVSRFETGWDAGEAELGFRLGDPVPRFDFISRTCFPVFGFFRQCADTGARFQSSEGSEAMVVMMNHFGFVEGDIGVAVTVVPIHTVFFEFLFVKLASGTE